MKCIYSLILLGFTATAQVVPNQYIVELTTEPVARVAGRQHKRVDRPDAGLAAHHARLDREQGSLRQQIEQRGGEVLDQFQTVENALVVRMSREKAAQVREMAGVKRVRSVRMYRPVLDHSLPLQKIPDAWQQIGGMDKAGLGIKIAIIDTGIDSKHPGFADGGAAAPDGFPKVNQDSDIANTNGRVIVARAYRDPSTRQVYPSTDIDGHGTGVAMIAAGGTNTGPFGPITGVAPKAWLGNYKVFPDSGGGAPDSIIIRGIEDAINDGMDVLNLSLGSFPAIRPTDDGLVIAVENAVAAGKIVTIAAGNDGSAPNTLGSPGSAPSAITVGSSVNDRDFTGVVTSAGHDPYAALPGDGRNSRTPISAPLIDISQFDPSGLACGSLPSGSLSGSVALIFRGTCLFSDKLNNARTAGAVAAIIYTDAARPDAINPSVGTASLPAVMVSYTDGLDLKARAGQDGGLTVTVDFSLTATPTNPLRLSSFSSRGPNADFGIKPDLLGVGGTIYSAAPLNLGSYTYGAGTSYSSPTVAGAAALLMAARPGLTTAQYRSLLVNSSGTFSVDGANPLDVQLGGAGLLNMTSSLAGAVALAPTSVSFGTGSGNVDQTRTFTITNIGAATDTFALSTQGIGSGPQPVFSTNTVQLDPGKSQDVSVRFNYPGLAPGPYQGFLVVQGTQSAAARVPYWYGIPTQAPSVLQILDAPTSVRAGALDTIYFRFVDTAGLAVTNGVTKDIVSGVDVADLQSDDADVPGAFWVDVRMPSRKGTVTVHIELNGVAQDVSITVN